SPPMASTSMPPTAARWPRILSEHLVPVAEPLTVALEPGGEASPRAVVSSAARALLDGAPRANSAASPIWPAWLAPHQVPAAERLTGTIPGPAGPGARARGGLAKRASASPGGS